MSVLDYILDGLEAELALERELGVRSLEIDSPIVVECVSEPRKEISSEPPKPRAAETLPLLFLHHRKLGPQETEMMMKIVEALGFTLETTPIVHEKPIPRAKFYVVLGRLALAKFLPDEHHAFDSWFTTGKGASMLFTRAPSDILRFKGVTPQLKKIKSDMWRSLKAVAEKLKTLEGDEHDVE